MGVETLSGPNLQSDGAVAVAPADESTSFKLYRHVVIGLVIALIAPFTLLAWPFAILLGIVIGRDAVERRSGVRRSAAATLVGILAVAGGILAAIFFGAIIGALIALPIVVLAGLSERAAADAEPIDRVIARIVIFTMPFLGYIVLVALGANINIRIGG
jgi:hypothetical protein